MTVFLNGTIFESLRLHYTQWTDFKPVSVRDVEGRCIVYILLWEENITSFEMRHAVSSRNERPPAVPN